MNKEQQAGLMTWETPVKCQENFLCWGVGEEVIKHWNKDPAVVNLHPWRHLETSFKNFLWLAQPRAGTWTRDIPHSAPTPAEPPVL